MLTKARMPNSPPSSRPMPLRLTPPKGIRGSDAVIALTKTMPASMSALSFSARSRSSVQTLEPRPNSESLASSIAAARGDGAEGLFAQDRGVRGGLGADHRRLVPGARLVGCLAAGDDAGAG